MHVYVTIGVRSVLWGVPWGVLVIALGVATWLLLLLRRVASGELTFHFRPGAFTPLGSGYGCASTCMPARVYDVLEGGGIDASNRGGSIGEAENNHKTEDPYSIEPREQSATWHKRERERSHRWGSSAAAHALPRGRLLDLSSTRVAVQTRVVFYL